MWTQATGCQWSWNSNLLRVLQYLLKKFQVAKPGKGSGGGMDKARSRKWWWKVLDPVPRPGTLLEDDTGKVEEEEEGEEDKEREDEDEDDIVESCQTSKSMLSLGQPISACQPISSAMPLSSAILQGSPCLVPLTHTPPSTATSPMHSHSMPRPPHTDHA